MVGAICVSKMSSKKWRFNRANHLPHLARLVISSHLRRRDELISGPRAARAFAPPPALSARREEAREHIFAGRRRKQLEFPFAGRPMSSRSWSILEMLIWEPSRGVPFLASHGLRWGWLPASNGTKGGRGTPLDQKATQPAPGGRGGQCTRGRRKASRWLGSRPSRRISEQC